MSGAVLAPGPASAPARPGVGSGTSAATAAPADIARFWSKVDQSDGCWLWIAGINSYGYGKFWLNRRYVGAHRLAYEWLVEPIPEGLQLDHLCRIRRCVNPAHLEAVTSRENVIRGQSPPAQRARQIACKRGHPFTPENTYISTNGTRKCRICRAAARRSTNSAARPTAVIPSAAAAQGVDARQPGLHHPTDVRSSPWGCGVLAHWTSPGPPVGCEVHGPGQTALPLLVPSARRPSTD